MDNLRESIWLSLDVMWRGKTSRKAICEGIENTCGLDEVCLCVTPNGLNSLGSVRILEEVVD